MKVANLFVVGFGNSKKPKEVEDAAACINALAAKHGRASQYVQKLLYGFDGDKFSMMAPVANPGADLAVLGQTERGVQLAGQGYTCGMYVVGNFYLGAQILEVINGKQMADLCRSLCHTVRRLDYICFVACNLGKNYDEAEVGDRPGFFVHQFCQNLGSGGFALRPVIACYRTFVEVVNDHLASEKSAAFVKGLDAKGDQPLAGKKFVEVNKKKHTLGLLSETDRSKFKLYVQYDADSQSPVVVKNKGGLIADPYGAVAEKMDEKKAAPVAPAAAAAAGGDDENRTLQINKSDCEAEFGVSPMFLPEHTVCTRKKDGEKYVYIGKGMFSLQKMNFYKLKAALAGGWRGKWAYG